MKTPIKVLAITILLATTHTTIGKNAPKPKHISSLAENVEKSHVKPKHRLRRSLEEEEDEPFWANRGKRSTDSSNSDDYIPKPDLHFSNDAEGRLQFGDKNSRNENPFWGNRGRRDLKEIDDFIIPSNRQEIYGNLILEKLQQGQKICIDGGSFGGKHFFSENGWMTKARREEEDNPFWGNRGRRSESEIEESPFWGSRGKRHEEGPFWGARGRREEDSPFWGSRGRKDDDLIFWGNRDRRMKDEEESPFWGARGRRYEENPIVDSRGIESLPDYAKNINVALSSRKRKTEGYWQDQGRTNTMRYMFNDKNRVKSSSNPNPHGRIGEFSSMKSLRQDTLYAEEPYYILVDRSSRSEDDPYFISRGKKKITSEELAQAVRGRRGTAQQLAKTAQADPYFISRGKKDKPSYDQLVKSKELICSAILQMESKVKRDSDSDRIRRNILKKLAAQLQSDPYYVSRGKKNIDKNDVSNLGEFVNEINDVCRIK